MSQHNTKGETPHPSPQASLSLSDAKLLEQLLSRVPPAAGQSPRSFQSSHQPQPFSPARSNEHLLLEMLSQVPPPSPSSSPSPPPPPPAKPRTTTLWGRVRGVLLTLLAVVVAVSILLIVNLAHSIIIIRQNIHAMQLPTMDTVGNTQAWEPAKQVRPFLPASLPDEVVDTVDGASPPTGTNSPPAREPSPEQERSVVLPEDETGEALTLLLLGSDRRRGEMFPSRTDAIVVMRVEPAHQRVAMLSLPRDLVVEIPGYGYGRINSANVYGEANAQPGGGIALTRHTVAILLNIPIDYVIWVQFEGFIDVVDTIGGITIEVEQELYDPQFPTMDYGYTIAHFLPGRQHMDGERALMYARLRHPDSDFARMRRQQQVILAIVTHLRKQHVVQQVETMADLTTALRDDIQTDLSIDRMMQIAWSLRGLSLDAVTSYTLDENMVMMGVFANDPYAMVARPGAIEHLVEQLMGRGGN